MIKGEVQRKSKLRLHSVDGTVTALMQCMVLWWLSILPKHGQNWPCFRSFQEKHVHNLSDTWFGSWREKTCTTFPALMHDMNNLTTIKGTSDRFMAREYFKHRYLTEQMQERILKIKYIQLAISDNLHTTLISRKDYQWIQRMWRKFCTSERSLWYLLLHMQGSQENPPCQN